MKDALNFKTISIKNLAGLVNNQLIKHALDAVLVGGSCVTIYSNNRFMSYDLDFVSYHSHKKIRAALEEIGFLYDKKKYFVHAECEFFLEFLNPPISIGNEPIETFSELKSVFGQITLLTATDCVKDRLAAYYHWDDPQSLLQAVGVSEAQKVDLEEIKRWSDQEGMGNKVKDFFLKLSKTNG